jgi:transcriptional regulator with XRE-family HTH domain
MTIGERIRKKREELGLTQEELATKMGYKHRSSVTKMEEAEELSLKKVRLVAEALGCSPSYLLDWDSSTPKTSTISKKSAPERALDIGNTILNNKDLFQLYSAVKNANHDDILTAYAMLMALKKKGSSHKS